MSDTGTQDPHRLKGGALGLVEAAVQSGADIAPAVAVVSSTVFLATLAGLASPLAVLLGTIIALALAKVVADYAKRMASPGAFYTFLTRSFGPKTGFSIGMLLFLAYVLLLLFQLPFFGQFVNGILVPHVHIAWWVWAILLIAWSTGLTVSGIRPSLRVGLIGLAFESIVFAILSIIIVAQGGATGNSIKPFELSQAPSASGLFLGIIFGIFIFVGFETSTTLGEETRDPHRTIPRALYLAVGSIGVLVVFFTYAAVIGFGVSKSGLAALQSNSVPYSYLAQRYGDTTLQVFVNIATVTSFLALNVIIMTAASRVLFTISRDGLAPAIFGRVNRLQTPANASLAIGAVSLVVVLITGAAWGALTTSGWYAFLSTMFFIAAYATACVGVSVYYYRYLRRHFRLVGNILIPLIALVGMGCVLYGNLHPFPAAPLNYFPFITLGIILVLALIARRLEKTNPEKVRRAAQLFVIEHAGDELRLPEQQGATDAAAPGVTTS
jgi:amino acid transporter